MDTTEHRRRERTRPSLWLQSVLGWLDPGEPHPHRGPFARWPRVTDGALVVVVFLASVFSVTLSRLGDGEAYTVDAITDVNGGAVLLLAAGSAALLLRRSRPIVVAAAVLALTIVWALAGEGDGNDLALVAATYAVGRYTTDPARSAAVLGSAMAVSVLGTLIDDTQRVDVAPAVLLPVAAWYVGRRVRNRGAYLTLLRERSERLEADQQARARQAVADERSRIARELHDVVAHQVSMMTVQAGAAKTIARDDLDTAVDAMGEVEHAGRQALGELRHLLGVLRADTTDADHLGPQPGIADISELTDHLEQAGAQVTLHIDQPRKLPASVDLSAYRILQEAITNIIKHAGPEPSVSISIRVDRHVLDLEVTNTTDGVARVLPRSGYGIAGMEERVSLLGGTLATGPLPPDGFRVHAQLPLEREQP